MLGLIVRPARPYHVRLHPCTFLLQHAIQQCTPLWRAFATSALLHKKSKSETKPKQKLELGKPKVKWFQQLYPWSTKRTPIDSDVGVLGEGYDEAKFLKDSIKQDDADIREMEGGGGKTTIEPLLKALPKEDAKEIRDAIRIEDIKDARKERELERLDREIARRMPKSEELEIKWNLPREQESYLKTLNEDIFKASSDIANRDLRKKLWHSYTRCKAFLPPFLHLVPKKSWNILWASQQAATPNDPHWAAHTITLSNDMAETGKGLNVYQRIIYIEALNSQDYQEQAIEKWQELKEVVGDDRRASDEHELLGVRLFASHNDPEKAERIALNFLGANKQLESRILIPILHAWAQRNDDIGIEHAWTLYLRFRMLVGDKITMDDYDNISMGFLNVGRTDIALAVFKDMMLTGEKPDHSSVELYRKSMDMMGRTQSSAVTVEDINRISLTGLTILPKSFQNKFFYGKWMKKLIGMGAVDAAAKVIDLMYERGVKPDAKHLNGIVGAWLRDGSVKAKEAGEKMAWAMIFERLKFVNARRQGHQSESSNLVVQSKMPAPQHIERLVVPANIETFSLLLLQYGRRAQDDNIRTITNHLEMAEILPNKYWINHLLYIDLRRGQHGAAWIKYKEMFGTVKPDLETFACLWDCEKTHLYSLKIHTRDPFPNPRRIMAEMMTWFSSIKSKAERKAVREEFDKRLYEQIIRCMGLASDFEGLIVSLYVLREHFGIYPDGNINRMVNLLVSRMKPVGRKTTPKFRSLLTTRNERKAMANEVVKFFALVDRQRQVVLTRHGMNDIAQFDGDVQREEGLFRLAEFLRVVLRRTGVDEDAVKGNIEKAAWDIGVGGIKMEDPLPSYGSIKEFYRIGRGGS